MQIDVKVTAERAKKVLKPTLLVIMAVVIAVLCCLAYYVISRPSPAQKITVWVSDVSFSYSEELQNDTLAAAQPYGIVKCTYVLRNPQDTYYGMAFSLSGARKLRRAGTVFALGGRRKRAGAGRQNGGYPPQRGRVPAVQRQQLQE